MTETKYDFGPQPHVTRVDSFAGFTETPLPFSAANDGVDDSKFSFSPRSGMMSFDPTTTASFSEGLQQTTVHPGVLSGNGLSLTDGIQTNMSEPFFAPQNIFTSLHNARSQHGQVTPPDDLSPKSSEAKPTFPDEGEFESRVKVERSPEPVKADNKRKRSAKTGNSTSSKKRGRKTVVAVDEEDLDPEEKAKRDQFLERNRVAAHKCRQKKKEWMSKLDDEFRDLSARNKCLQAEVSLLSNTLYELKNLIFQHTDCGYTPINEFIHLEAERVKMRAMSTGGMQQARGSFTQPAPDFTGAGPGAFPGQCTADSDGAVVERASTESSDFGSLRSRSAAPDGMMPEQWTDMLQQP